MIELGGAMKTPILILLVLFSVLSAQHKVQHKMMTEEEQSGHHRFDDAEKWADVFEDSTRDEWQLPDEVIESLAIGKEDVIADIGSATGYFPIRFARTAISGRVYGIDIEPNQVDYLNARAKRDNLPNLESIPGRSKRSEDPGKSGSGLHLQHISPYPSSR
jgi:tRNA G46 methylase TrmB